MPKHSPAYHRRQSGRGPSGRGAPQADAVVIALTAQVLICVLLLLLAVAVKKANEQGYSEIKREYDILVTGVGGGGGEKDEVIDEIAGIGGALQQAFASIEQAVRDFMGRFGGGEESPVAEITPETPALPEATLPEGQTQEDSVDEPLDDYEPPPAEDEDETEDETEAPGQTAGSFAFDYLSPSNVIYTSLGQGGLNPVALGGESAAGQPPPENCTYAQVLLSARMKPPVTGLLTSQFAYREHPITGEDDFHNGIDIAAAEGRDILAALHGEVVEVGESEIYGNYIILQHATNLRTFYAHCSEIIAEEGMKVRQGERIAKVGNTGISTGPHLHFAVIVEEMYTDPCWVLQDNIRLVD